MLKCSRHHSLHTKPLARLIPTIALSVGGSQAPHFIWGVPHGFSKHLHVAAHPIWNEIKSGFVRNVLSLGNVTRFFFVIVKKMYCACILSSGTLREHDTPWGFWADKTMSWRVWGDTAHPGREGPSLSRCHPSLEGDWREHGPALGDQRACSPSLGDLADVWV